MKLGQEYFFTQTGEATIPTTPLGATPHWRGPGAAAPRCAAPSFGGVGADGLFHRLPLPVEIAKPPGQLLRPGGVAGLQQIRRHVRRAHAARGVDPGREHKADLDGGDGLAQKSRLFQKGVNPHEIRVGQGLQSAGNDGAVLPPSIRMTSATVPMAAGCSTGQRGHPPDFLLPEPAPASAPRPRPPDA